jgi:hypothetical protein
MKIKSSGKFSSNAKELLLDSQQPELAEIKTRLERRSGERRIACKLSAAQISSEEGGHTDVKGFILNVSKSGLGFCADKPFRRGTNVVVTMDSVKVHGNVRWCRWNPGDFFDMGLQIQDVIVIGKNTPKAADPAGI